jgi:hypothetical protein
MLTKQYRAIDPKAKRRKKTNVPETLYKSSSLLACRQTK